MTSRAITARLKAGQAERYLALHSSPMEGVREALWNANIRGFEVFRHAPTNTLFARYAYVGEDLAADLQACALDPVTRDWHALVHPCLQNDDAPWSDMERIFTLLPDSAPQRLPTRLLGQSGVSISEIGFGGAGLAKTSAADADATLQSAWSAGIRYFDTAPHYGQGLSERRLGDFLRGKPAQEYVLSTKVGRILEPNPNATPLPFSSRFDYSGPGLLRSYEDSLQRLGLSKVDLLLIHDIGRFCHGDSADAHMAALRETGLPALSALKAQGRVRAIGVGVNECEVATELLATGLIDCVLIAGRYTLLDRTAERSLLPLAAQKGVGIIAAGLFNSGLLLPNGPETFDYRPAKPHEKARALAIGRAVSKAGASLVPTATRFPLQNKAVASALIGSPDPFTTRQACGFQGVTSGVYAAIKDKRIK